MRELESLRRAIISRRKALGLRQQALAEAARISLPTLKSLEQGRLGELGFSKAVRILAALGLELELKEANQGRPTLEDLENEPADD